MNFIDVASYESIDKLNAQLTYLRSLLTDFKDLAEKGRLNFNKEEAIQLKDLVQYKLPLFSNDDYLAFIVPSGRYVFSMRTHNPLESQLGGYTLKYELGLWKFVFSTGVPVFINDLSYYGIKLINQPSEGLTVNISMAMDTGDYYQPYVQRIYENKMLPEEDDDTLFSDDEFYPFIPNDRLMYFLSNDEKYRFVIGAKFKFEDLYKDNIFNVDANNNKFGINICGQEYTTSITEDIVNHYVDEAGNVYGDDLIVYVTGEFSITNDWGVDLWFPKEIAEFTPHIIPIQIISFVMYNTKYDDVYKQLYRWEEGYQEKENERLNFFTAIPASEDMQYLVANTLGILSSEKKYYGSDVKDTEDGKEVGTVNGNLSYITSDYPYYIQETTDGYDVYKVGEGKKDTAETKEEADAKVEELKNADNQNNTTSTDGGKTDTEVSKELSESTSNSNELQTMTQLESVTKKALENSQVDRINKYLDGETVKIIATW